MAYERSDDRRDPLAVALASIDRAQDEIEEIRLGALDANDRAAVARARNDLMAAVARCSDVLEDGTAEGASASVEPARAPRS